MYLDWLISLFNSCFQEDTKSHHEVVLLQFAYVGMFTCRFYPWKITSAWMYFLGYRVSVSSCIYFFCGKFWTVNYVTFLHKLLFLLVFSFLLNNVLFPLTVKSIEHETKTDGLYLKLWSLKRKTGVHCLIEALIRVPSGQWNSAALQVFYISLFDSQ